MPRTPWHPHDHNDNFLLGANPSRSHAGRIIQDLDMIATDEPTIGRSTPLRFAIAGSSSGPCACPVRCGLLLELGGLPESARLQRLGGERWSGSDLRVPGADWLGRSLARRCRSPRSAWSSFLRRFKTHFPGVPCILRVRNPERWRRPANSRSDCRFGRASPESLADYLWELAAFEFFLEA